MFQRWSSSLVALTIVWAASPATADDARAEFFEKRVRPALVEHCFKCHSGEVKEPKSGLRVDSRAALLAGGARGPAINAKKPEESLLIEAIRYGNVDLHMPPRGKLPEPVIADLTRWIKDGAVWPGDSGVFAAKKSDFDLQKRKREHWAWQPVKAAAPPNVQNKQWSRHPVDAFILKKLEERSLKPAASADSRTLIRRLYFDLTGLPPTPDEIDGFLHDSALRIQVDRLLDSPRFGERWARHWLDLVRYAETRGHEFDHTLPNAWQYRDYVIRAINADVPYSQFVVEHVAGDLLPKPRLHEAGFNESILGTGFWLLGEEVHSPVDIRLDQADRFDNRIDVFGKTFLGMTVACARCHDHKFDAISAKDYYALFGYLSSGNYRSVRFDHWEHNRRIARELAKVRREGQLAIAQSWAKSVTPAIERSADYMMAARDVLRGNKKDVETVATEQRLDAKRLATWVSEIQAAVKDDRHPLFPFAQLTKGNPKESPDRSREVLKKWTPGPASATPQAGVIVDFSRKDAAFLPDDVSFGLGPVLPGTPRVTKVGNELGLRFTTESVAEKDSLWDGMKVAPGTESDAGALASPNRAGRTIRTPTFVVGNGKVWFRMRGTAQVYAAVSQHVMIAGPLHARLVQTVKAGAALSWHAIDLSLYNGLPAHLEFTAEDGAGFALASVVQSEKRPALTLNLPKLANALGRAKTAREFAKEYQSAFAAAVAAMGRPAEREAALLADWLVSHQDLTGAVHAWHDEFRRLAESESDLAAKILKESRLALAMQDRPGFDEHVFIRGQPKLRGERVPRRFLEALDSTPAPKHTSGRLELARQMIDPERNPLVARVFVNRVWHHLFGRGLVASVDNFGVLGETPTHPELLDYLANWFVKNGWSLKKLIKMLVLTKTYQRSARADDRSLAADPQNLLLQHARVRRLEGEAIRDALLQLSGRLDTTMFGPPVLVHLSAFQDGRGRPASGPLDGAGRRSIYLGVRRNFLSSFLLAFDTPTPFSTMGRRTVSNVPAQALILLNDPFVQEQAALWAKRILKTDSTTDARITRMYVQAFGRAPAANELADCRQFLAEQARNSGRSANDAMVWSDLAHVLINAKEFIFLN